RREGLRGRGRLASGLRRRERRRLEQYRSEVPKNDRRDRSRRPLRGRGKDRDAALTDTAAGPYSGRSTSSPRRISRSAGSERNGRNPGGGGAAAPRTLGAGRRE